MANMIETSSFYPIENGWNERGRFLSCCWQVGKRPWFYGIKAFCGKRISGKTPTIKNAILTNFVRMLFCIVFGFLFVLVIDGVGALKMDGMAILLALGGSVATCVFLVSWLLAMRKNAYMTVEAFVLVSMLVPVLLKLLLYGEKVDLFQWIGLAILIFAVVLMSIYNNQTKGKLTAVGVLLLLVVCLGNGLNSFTQNVFKTEFSLLTRELLQTQNQGTLLKKYQ